MFKKVLVPVILVRMFCTRVYEDALTSCLKRCHYSSPTRRKETYSHAHLAVATANGWAPSLERAFLRSTWEHFKHTTLLCKMVQGFRSDMGWLNFNLRDTNVREVVFELGECVCVCGSSHYISADRIHLLVCVWYRCIGRRPWRLNEMKIIWWLNEFMEMFGSFIASCFDSCLEMTLFDLCICARYVQAFIYFMNFQRAVNRL